MGPSRRRPAVLATLAVALVAVLLPGTAAATPTVAGVFKVPGVETNNKLVAGPEGDIWVTIAGATDNVARVTPAGEVKEYKLGLEGTTGIAVGPEGKLWVTASGNVASFSASNPEGTVAKTSITSVKAEVSSIVAGPDHKMWVATEGAVLRFLPATPSMVEEGLLPGLSPRDIDSAAGLVAVADAGAPRILTFNAAFEEHDLVYGATGASQGLAVGPTGQIAFSDPGATPEQIGLVSPPVPAQTQTQLGDPFGVTYGPDGAFWFAQFADGGVVQLTAEGAKTFLGGLPKESPRQITSGPGNTLWVTLVKTGEEGVARISGVEPPVTVPPGGTPVVTPPAPSPQPVTPAPGPPQTQIAKAPRHHVVATGKRTQVSFRFAATPAATRFECALSNLRTPKSSKKPPRFASCSSPKAFKLAPARYRFQVRAVGAGGTDPTPAVFTFRVELPASHTRAERGAAPA